MSARLTVVGLKRRTAPVLVVEDDPELRRLGPRSSDRPSRQAASNSRVVDPPRVTQQGQRSAATVFRITAYCYDARGDLKVANLGSWPCREYQASVERLLDDERFFKALENRLSSKGLAPSRCQSVYVGLRNVKPSRVFPKVSP